MINENKLWKWFSLFIRLRDALPDSGICFCFTCGRPRHYTGGDCGHGIGRQHRATKYNEKNNHFQCKLCNGFEGGRADVYKLKVDEKYGEGTWDTLLVLSKKSVKWSQFEIDIMAKEYQKLAEEIKLKKNIK